MNSKVGDYLASHYFDNTGGINISDTPFKVQEGQATDGVNYSYLYTGGFKKRDGHTKINVAPDTKLKSLGVGLFNTSQGAKTVIRAADTKFQAVDISALSFTALSDDTASASSDFFSASSTQPVVFSQFNSAVGNGLWAAGGGLSSIYGVVSSTQVTKNGVAAPTGAISTSVTTPGTGTFSATGTFFYAVAFRKRSTQATSNAALDISATIAATTNNVVINLSGITGIDTTLYDQIYIYRSAVSGVSAFTTGDLIAQVASTATSYTDTGSYIATAQNIPRAGNTLLDKSTCPVTNPTCLTVFKRRLVVAQGSTIYASDLNLPESWPAGNTITIPSGGDIKGLAIISFTSTGSNTIDEILCVFKERELWVVTGNGNLADLTNTGLKFIDAVGCPNQSLIVNANGFISWVEYGSVYMWDGTGKPLRCSRTIKPLFEQDGDLDISKLSYGVGVYCRKLESIVWYLSHKIYGEQQFQLKMDLNLTIPSIQQNLSGRHVEAVFSFDSTAFPIYSAASVIAPGIQETLLMGDSSGYLYNGYTDSSDAGSAFSFRYATNYLFCGDPIAEKRFQYVVVWVQELGTWNLTLDWWTDYKSSKAAQSTRALPISEVQSNLSSFWDLAQWDASNWDDYNTKLRPLVFRLTSDSMNNSDGKSIRLQFRQEGADNPVSIAGFSVLYTEKGLHL